MDTMKLSQQLNQVPAAMTAWNRETMLEDSSNQTTTLINPEEAVTTTQISAVREVLDILSMEVTSKFSRQHSQEAILEDGSNQPAVLISPD